MGVTFPAGTPPPTPNKDAFTVTVGKCCLRFVSSSSAPVFLALFFFCRMFTFHLHQAEVLIGGRIEQAGGDVCLKQMGSQARDRMTAGFNNRTSQGT